MIVINKNSYTKIYWKIFRGENKVSEDFHSINTELKVFLVGPCDKRLITYNINRSINPGYDVVEIDVHPNTLSEGVYDLRAIWWKNKGRDLMTSNRCGIFGITDSSEEAPVEDLVEIKIASYTESFGRDGMSAYEAAVMYDLHLGITSEREWVMQETIRIENEDIRKNAEEGRITAEISRKNNENSRVSAEEVRERKEYIRDSNELVRISNESGRQSAEGSRKSSEEDREASEQERYINERGRIQSEKARMSAESARVASEGAREEAESKRKGAESYRETAEAQRVSAFNINEEQRKKGETSREAAEAQRVEAEKGRAAAEAARQATFTTNEESRKETFDTNEAKREAEFDTAIQSAKDNLIVVNDLTTGGADKALSAEMGKELDGKVTELGREVGRIIPSVEGFINLSLYDNIQWIDDGANGWRSLKGYNSIFIPCYGGMKYKVIGNSAYNSVVSVITALPTTDREAVSYAEGESRKKLNLGGTVIFTVGNDAKYICIMSVYNSNDVAPQLVNVLSNDRIDKLESTVDATTDRLNELEENINADLNEIKVDTKNELWNIKANFNYELNVETTEGASWVSQTLDNPIPKGTKIVSFNGYDNKINFRKIVDGAFVVVTGGTESDLPIILNEDCINVQMVVGGKVSISLQGEIIQYLEKDTKRTEAIEADVKSLYGKIGGEINVDSYEVVKWIDDGANGWRNINNYTSIFIPCSKGETYRIVGNAVNDSFVSVITALPTTDREAVSYAEGESRRVLKLGTEVEFVIGEDARYICVRIQNGTKDPTPQLIELLSTFQNKQGVGIELEKQGNITTISTKNNDPLEARLQALVYNPAIPAGVILEAKILSLIHFSDVHGCEDNVKRIVAFQKKYNNYIDEILHTGDIAYSYWYWAYRWNEIGAGHILNTIGNHDAEAVGTGDIISEGESYNMYFKDYINNWGCQYTEGKCYYYKDYTDKSIRLIVIDCIHDSDAQRIWFADALNGALTNGYAVVCVSHYRPEDVDYMYESTTFCSYDIENNGRIDISYVNAVDSFIEGGGVFVTWLCGHTHRDLCGTLTNHPKQFVIVIENAQCGGIKTLVTGDGITYEERVLTNLSETSPRKAGTITQDCFNVVSIDVSNKALKVFRVGSNVDFRGRVKDTLSWDFEKYRLVKTN